MTGQVREAQRQRKADQETFAAGQAGCRPDDVGLVAVNDEQFKVIFFAFENLVAVAQFLQVEVGQVGQAAEGESLREAVEFFAVA